MGYLIAAYALVLLSWIGYAWRLARRRRALLAELSVVVHDTGSREPGP